MHLLHGPNLNLLGQREPSLYGSRSFLDLVASVRAYAQQRGLAVQDFQTNDEAAMLDYVHRLSPSDWVILNAGAWTHTSVALRDALAGVGAPFVEVHLSQVHARESFRHRSYLSARARAVIAGFGDLGYQRAIDYIAAQSVAS